LGITTDITQIKEHEIALLEAQTELQQQYQQLQQAWRQTIDVLSSTTEAKDPYTAGHQRRVAKLSVAIGNEMGLDEETQTILLLAGAIHDIGKINIPGEILSKPGKLNPIERRLIETHSTAGYDILKSLQLPWPIARIIYQHHERMDGSGYPQRLQGPDVLPEARVIMVADVVESMMSHRPYRMALGQEAALAEIRAGRGTRFDPQVVDACMALFDEQRFEF
jgi:putative nucleotidyltransferase with HDIG domain